MDGRCGVDFFRACGYGAAMGNADAITLAVADEITQSNGCNCVAVFPERRLGLAAPISSHGGMQMMTRDMLRQDHALRSDKAWDALCGLPIGDSFGDAARKPDDQRDYGFTTDFHKGESWSTDNAKFALLAAETIISCGGDFPPRKWRGCGRSTRCCRTSCAGAA